MSTLLKSSFTYAMAKLALHYGEDKDTTKAEELLKKVLDKNDILQVVNLYYGQFHQYHNKCEPLAIKHYKEGLELQKDTAEEKRCIQKRMIAEKRFSKDHTDEKACGILGVVYKIQGEKQQAIEWYDMAVVYDMENDKYLSVHCELCLSLQ